MTKLSRTDITRLFVKSRRRKYTELAELTGLDKVWLSKFACGVIKDPASSKIDALMVAMEHYYRQERAENATD